MRGKLIVLAVLALVALQIGVARADLADLDLATGLFTGAGDGWCRQNGSQGGSAGSFQKGASSGRGHGWLLLESRLQPANLHGLHDDH